MGASHVYQARRADNLIEWLIVMVVFVSTPERVEAGIIKQGEQYVQREECERAADKANEPLKVIVVEARREVKAPVWLCLPVVEDKK